jgi:uncharacterized protein YbjT (DUF2867 family)
LLAALLAALLAHRHFTCCFTYGKGARVVVDSRDARAVQRHTAQQGGKKKQTGKKEASKAVN